MRIHTNTLYAPDLQDAVNDLDGVSVTASQHGSRDYARAFEVRLEGNGRTGGQWGNTTAKGATWDEYGVFLARLYAIDPYMLCGSPKRPLYLSRDDFDFQTGYRFEDGTMPEDTHKQHRWERETDMAQVCVKCSASRSAPVR